MAQLKETTIDGKLTILNNNIHLDNGNVLYGLNTSGEDRAMVQINTSDEMFFGYGGYKNNEGKSYFDGNEVHIRSKGGTYITDPDAGLSERAYGQNKVLWSGGYLMTRDHIANLSEPISAQPHGVVLVWSAYSTNTVQDWGFSTHFIPKYFVEAHVGGGMDFPLIRQGFGKLASKYLYISNTKITGHDNNNITGTVNGITYDNSYFVLRYVIGV